MEFVNTFDKHKEDPDKNLGSYAKEKKIELGRSLIDVKKIYLDTNYWILLCEAYLGRAKNEKQDQLLRTAEGLSSTGKFIFPICQDIFLEILKQTDSETLRATVTLIDKLSKGVSLISTDERYHLEIFHFVESKRGSPVYELQELAWTKLAYNMGFLTPDNSNIPSDLNILLQKTFFDQMWSITLLDMINIMSENGSVNIPPTPDISKKLNIGKFEHENENKTFEQMFLSELAGILDIYKGEFQNLFIYMSEKQTGVPPKPEDISADNSGQILANVTYNLFRLHKINTELPTYRIHAGLHAAVRWDRMQKYQTNDMHDFGHAVAAVPYCDLFFTEKRLCHLITQKMLGYDKLYNCVVLCKLNDIVSCLSELSK